MVFDWSNCTDFLLQQQLGLTMHCQQTFQKKSAENYSAPQAVTREPTALRGRNVQRCWQVPRLSTKGHVSTRARSPVRWTQLRTALAPRKFWSSKIAWTVSNGIHIVKRFRIMTHFKTNLYTYRKNSWCGVWKVTQVWKNTVNFTQHTISFSNLIKEKSFEAHKRNEGRNIAFEGTGSV